MRTARSANSWSPKLRCGIEHGRDDVTRHLGVPAGPPVELVTADAARPDPVLAANKPAQSIVERLLEGSRSPSRESVVPGHPLRESNRVARQHDGVRRPQKRRALEHELRKMARHRREASPLHEPRILLSAVPECTCVEDAVVSSRRCAHLLRVCTTSLSRLAGRRWP